MSGLSTPELGGTAGQPRRAEISHGTHCDCVLLAAALGLGSQVISFYYCRTLLQRRWAMTCKHGEVQGKDAPISLGEKWKDKGDMNPVLAILLKNG